MPCTLQNYLDETLYMRDGKPVKRGDEISLSRKAFLKEIWPVAFKAGYETAVQDGFKAKPRVHQSVKQLKEIVP